MRWLKCNLMKDFDECFAMMSKHVITSQLKISKRKHGCSQIQTHSYGVYREMAGEIKRKDWKTSHWRHNELGGVSDHQPHDCLLTCLFRHRSKKTSKLRVTGLCEGNSPGTGEFPAQKASNAQNASIWWRHHDAHGSHIIIMCCNLISDNFTHIFRDYFAGVREIYDPLLS